MGWLEAVGHRLWAALAFCRHKGPWSDAGRAQRGPWEGAAVTSQQKHPGSAGSQARDRTHPGALCWPLPALPVGDRGSGGPQCFPWGPAAVCQGPARMRGSRHPVVARATHPSIGRLPNPTQGLAFQLPCLWKTAF